MLIPILSDSSLSCIFLSANSNEQDNLYLFDYRSEISDAIGNALGIDFTLRRLRLADIKNILAKNNVSPTYFCKNMKAASPVFGRVAASFMLFLLSKSGYNKNCKKERVRRLNDKINPA